MTFVRMVKVSIVQVVDVATVTYYGVSTTWSMLMSMVGMGWGEATRHGDSIVSNLRCANAAVRIFCGDV